MRHTPSAKVPTPATEVASGAAAGTTPPAAPGSAGATPAAAPKVAGTAPAAAPRATDGVSRLRAIFHVISRSGVLVFILAFVIALLIGAVLIAISGSNPLEAYGAMFRGAIFNPQAVSVARMFQPLATTISSAVPLILAGLGLALGFRAGLFNIGGQGQLIFGAIAAAWVGFAVDLPSGVHVLVALIAGILGGAAYGFIPGILKAKTGASEVIMTIMLNSVAALFLAFILTKPYWQVGNNQPRSPLLADSARFPIIIGPPFNVDIAMLVAVLAAVFVWWYLERSTWGFELRAIGGNPTAAASAGISISKVTALTLTLSGALCGTAGAIQVQSNIGYLDGGVPGSIGIDAITVALLGRSRPLGTFFAGLLFGAFKAGGRLMQIETGVPIDFVLVIQSVIVLLLAAPALIRWLFRLPEPDHLTLRQLVAGQGEKKALATVQPAGTSNPAGTSKPAATAKHIDMAAGKAERGEAETAKHADSQSASGTSQKGA
ncbi:ABC transporter permease [Actinobaculum suis]|uniref:ABC transporter permease n=1 Tax=Actinobaculum suis TaxID=1657 RepID=UPI00069D1EC6|nr:ABC transporter permease [Actinobaculum suis]